MFTEGKVLLQAKSLLGENDPVPTIWHLSRMAKAPKSRSKRRSAADEGLMELPPERLQLAAWLELAQVKPADVVRGTGLSAGYISQLMDPEGYDKVPTRDTLRRLALFLSASLRFEISPDDLFRTPPSAEAVKVARSMRSFQR